MGARAGRLLSERFGEPSEKCWRNRLVTPGPWRPLLWREERSPARSPSVGAKRQSCGTASPWTHAFASRARVRLARTCSPCPEAPSALRTTPRTCGRRRPGPRSASCATGASVRAALRGFRRWSRLCCTRVCVCKCAAPDRSCILGWSRLVSRAAGEATVQGCCSLRPRVRVRSYVTAGSQMDFRPHDRISASSASLVRHRCQDSPRSVRFDMGPSSYLSLGAKVVARFLDDGSTRALWIASVGQASMAVASALHVNHTRVCAQRYRGMQSCTRFPTSRAWRATRCGEFRQCVMGRSWFNQVSRLGMTRLQMLESGRLLRRSVAVWGSGAATCIVLLCLCMSIAIWARAFRWNGCVLADESRTRSAAVWSPAAWVPAHLSHAMHVAAFFAAPGRRPALGKSKRRPSLLSTFRAIRRRLHFVCAAIRTRDLCASGPRWRRRMSRR